MVAALGLSSPTEPSAIITLRQGIELFDLPRITQKRVADLLLSVPTHKATGDDGISAKILRIAALVISPSPTKLMNLLPVYKDFPTAWKIAKFTPVFIGNGNKYDKNNYRPISVLPVLSKVRKKNM